MAGMQRRVKEAARNFRLPLQIPSILSEWQSLVPEPRLCPERGVLGLPHNTSCKEEQRGRAQTSALSLDADRRDTRQIWRVGWLLHGVHQPRSQEMTLRPAVYQNREFFKK